MNGHDESEQQPAQVAKAPNPVGEVRALPESMDWVERSVWTEAMLRRLAGGESANRIWFTLVDKIYAPANLRRSFEKVWRKRGCAGADRQTVEQFKRNVEEELLRLHRQLSEGTYRPQPVRRAWIDKLGTKEQRPLGIPAVRDRIVQAALRHVLEPIFEREFHEPSYGFRPNRGAKDALRRVVQLMKAGYVHVVDADLKAYFDTIPHDRLLALVKARVADGRVLALVEGFLRAGVLEEGRGWQATERGTPQGGVISPLLANIYLNPLDHEMAARGYEMVRYADDFVILCRTAEEAREALAVVQAWVESAGLRLHPDKTRQVDTRGRGGFDFLGYHFERGHRWPRGKSMGKMKDAIRAKTRRKDGRSLKAVLEDVNATLRGWYEYFQHSVANVFEPLDGFVRRRLRSMLEKRRGRTRFGQGTSHQRWPNEWFARAGLASLKAMHDWTLAIARLRTH